MANIQKISLSEIVSSVLSMKFGRTENLLDMLTEYENLRFYILGLNWRKLYQTGTWDILIDKQMSANC